MSDYTPFPGASPGFPGAAPAGGGAFPPQGVPAGGFPQGAPGPGGPGFGSPAPRAQQPAGAPAPGRSRQQPETPAQGRRGKGGPAKEAADKPVKAPTKRLISRQVVIAVVFAILAGGVVVKVMSGADDNKFVVRATSDIAAGTAVSGQLLEAAELPADAIEPKTFSGDTAQEALDAALAELDGVVSQYPLSAKSQLRSDQFGMQATLGAELSSTERLVSIRASVSTSVAGGLMVGDRVDIVGATDGWTRVVAYNVPIMSITVSEDRYDSVADQQSADKDVNPDDMLPGNPVPGIYVVKIAADLVPAVLNWNESATLYLAYRPAGSVDVVVPDNYLTDAANVPAPQAPAAPETSAAPEQDASDD